MNKFRREFNNLKKSNPLKLNMKQKVNIVSFPGSILAESNKYLF